MTKIYVHTNQEVSLFLLSFEKYKNHGRFFYNSRCKLKRDRWHLFRDILYAIVFALLRGTFGHASCTFNDQNGNISWPGLKIISAHKCCSKIKKQWLWGLTCFLYANFAYKSKTMLSKLFNMSLSRQHVSNKTHDLHVNFTS